MNKKVVYGIMFLAMLITLIILTPKTYASESAKCFGNSSLISTNANIALAINGFQSLGYSTSSSVGQITRSDILSWIGNSGNGYGFYINTHGNNLGGKLVFMDYWSGLIDVDDITGNWHLVYLDCCNCGDNNSFANAFKINGYSNRGFLSWNGKVAEADATNFNRYFWSTYVTNTSIRQAAVNAAANVPRARNYTY